MTRMTRRTFVMASVLTSAAAYTGVFATSGTASAAPPAPLPALQFQGLFPKRPYAAATIRHADYGPALVRAVKALGGPELLGQPGERVVIKPTLAWNRLPGQGANVHPDVLQAAIRLALEGGAGEVLVFDRTGLPPAVAYSISGAAEAVRTVGDARVHLLPLTEADFVPFPAHAAAHVTPSARQGEGEIAEAAAYLAAYRVCRYLLDADRVINIATARHHPTQRVTLGMANLVGLIGGGPADAAWLRHRDAHLALLSAAVRPELTILDATRAIVRNGPMGRGLPDVARWDTLVVSRDPVAVEAVGAQMYGLAAQDLPHMALAEQLSVGVAALYRSRLVEL